MYEVNSIVRIITDDGDGEVMRVINQEGEVVQCASSDDDNERFIDACDIELVTDSQEIHKKMEPLVPNVSGRTYDEVHDDIVKMFIQVVQWLRANGCDKKVELTISAENYDDRDMDVSFEVGLGYETNIVSKDLFRSAKIALARSEENETLKPLSIPMFVREH